jgi:aspartate aminotransferase
MNEEHAMDMIGTPISRRASALGALPISRLIADYFERSVYAQRRGEDDIADFTFGNPHDPPADGYVAALRDAVVPQRPDWFAYQTHVPAAQEAAAAGLRGLLGLPFEAQDVLLTTGGFAAIAVALKVVADPGDEVIFSLPPWFIYEGLATEAGLVPVKVRVDPAGFDLDLDAIAAAVTPRTRVVIVNSPNNPTGRVYPAATLRRLAALLDDASARIGRRIFLISDEPYNRLVFDGARFRSPVEFYPHGVLAYSYGKTHLAPGQRIGYVALPPAMPAADRAALRAAIMDVQIAIGWAFPNAVMQYALPTLERFTIDVDRLQRRRDRLVAELGGLGYELTPPEGTFYLWVRSPVADDRAFADTLAEAGAFVLPGFIFETPGFFRICLTATDAMIDRGLPAFAAAIAAVGQRGAVGVR